MSACGLHHALLVRVDAAEVISVREIASRDTTRKNVFWPSHTPFKATIRKALEILNRPWRTVVLQPDSRGAAAARRVLTRRYGTYTKRA